ncbi:hypothetical protein ACSQ67_008620 [Phaseolus vulgaris]
MEKNDFSKEGEMPMNLNIEDKAPPTPKQPFFIGVAGGTASGKTTVCNMINTQLRDQRVVLISQDSFYHTLSDQTLQKVNEYNFDHPDAFDTKLLLSTMEKLKCGQPVDIPNYDFKNHKRIESARQVHAGDIIILEGILVLHDQGVRNNLNMKIFVDEDSDVRLSRRMKRLAIDHGRNVENVLEQVVEHGLGHLPFSEKQVITPTGKVYVEKFKQLFGVRILSYL